MPFTKHAEALFQSLTEKEKKMIASCAESLIRTRPGFDYNTIDWNDLSKKPYVVENASEEAVLEFKINEN
jgi:hypothetical protein